MPPLSENIMKKGFTVIEFMIVVALVAIIAVIAIPALLSNRKQANEANAVAALKTYATAQATYKSRNISETSINCNHSAGKPKWYADLYIALYADTDSTRNAIRLIAEAFYNADAQGYKTKGAFEGYFFTDDATIPPSGWETRFGLYADPAEYGKSGTKSFYIETDGVVKMNDMQGAGAGANTAAWSAV